MSEDVKVTEKKRGRPFANAQISKETILKIAVEEFGNKGFDGARQRDIAKKAGVSNAVLNYHFEDKEDIWKQSVLLLAKEFESRYEKISSFFKDLDDLTAMKAFVRQFIYFAAEYPAFHKIVFHEMCTQTHRATWLVSEVLAPFHQFVDDKYSSQKDGKMMFNGYPAANFSSIIIGASNSFFTHAFQMKKMYGVDPFTPNEIEQHADMVVDLLFYKFKG